VDNILFEKQTARHDKANSGTISVGTMRRLRQHHIVYGEVNWVQLERIYGSIILRQLWKLEAKKSVAAIEMGPLSIIV
jgi:hypothetical protein